MAAAVHTVPKAACVQGVNSSVCRCALPLQLPVCGVQPAAWLWVLPVAPVLLAAARGWLWGTIEPAGITGIQHFICRVLLLLLTECIVPAVCVRLCVCMTAICLGVLTQPVALISGGLPALLLHGGPSADYDSLFDSPEHQGIDWVLWWGGHHVRRQRNPPALRHHSRHAATPAWWLGLIPYQQSCCCSVMHPWPVCFS